MDGEKIYKNNRGGQRPGAGRKSKGETLQINCRVKAEVKERLQQIAEQRGESITTVLEDLIMRESI